jgi:hypothetical protein
MDPELTPLLRCSTVRDLPVPGVPSKRTRCNVCGAWVWVSDMMKGVLNRRWPGRSYYVACMYCEVEGGQDIAITHLPEQIVLMRSQGIEDEMIVYTLAVADASGGRMTLERAEAEIRDHPMGLVARAFPHAVERARMAVAVAAGPSTN